MIAAGRVRQIDFYNFGYKALSGEISSIFHLICQNILKCPISPKKWSVGPLRGHQ